MSKRHETAPGQFSRRRLLFQALTIRPNSYNDRMDLWDSAVSARLKEDLADLDRS